MEEKYRKYIVALGIFLVAIGLWSVIENIIEYKSIVGILWISNLTAIIIGLTLLTKNKKLLAIGCFMAVFPAYAFFKEFTIKYYIIRWLLIHTIGPITGIALVLKSKKAISQVFSYKEQTTGLIFVAAIELVSFFASTPAQNINFSHNSKLVLYLTVMGMVWFFLTPYINNKQK